MWINYRECWKTVFSAHFYRIKDKNNTLPMFWFNEGNLKKNTICFGIQKCVHNNLRIYITLQSIIQFTRASLANVFNWSWLNSGMLSNRLFYTCEQLHFNGNERKTKDILFVVLCISSCANISISSDKFQYDEMNKHKDERGNERMCEQALGGRLYPYHAYNVSVEQWEKPTHKIRWEISSWKRTKCDCSNFIYTMDWLCSSQGHLKTIAIHCEY